MARHALWAIVLAMALSSAAQAQQSWGERCNSLPRGSEPGMVEFCQGIAAATGYNSNGKRDEEAALRHYQRAAELGFAEAQATMGQVYERGWHVQQNFATAAEWYAKAAAQGHAGAELNLGDLYARGRGVPRDPVKARQLIEAAANQGLAPAKRALAALNGHGPGSFPGAAIYQQGVARYRAGDHAGAAQLIRQAAQAGNPTATYEMGYLYENGDGVPKDIAQAAQWYLKGAAMGEPSSEAAVGLLYEEGRQVRDDWVEAAKWYMKSAQQDNRTGEFRLGRAYQYGIGVPLNLTEAMKWYDKAAAQGDSQAAFFAKYIRDNHGIDMTSATPQEQAVLQSVGLRWIPEPAPIGTLFRNSRERMAYVQRMAHGEIEAKRRAMWENANQDFQNCRNRGGDNCQRPLGPRPQ